jgi:hypothetical protein
VKKFGYRGEVFTIYEEKAGFFSSTAGAAAGYFAKLDALGAKGWELVTVVPMPHVVQTSVTATQHQALFLFKRDESTGT